MSEVAVESKQQMMMTAVVNGGAASPRSDLSESQLWEVIGAESASGDGHIMAPAGTSAEACYCFCAVITYLG